MMSRAAGALAIGFAATVGLPNPAIAKMDLQLGPQGLQDSSGTLITVGTAGMGAHLAGSYQPAKGDDPYYFNIPSERPVESAPGILFHIPFGDNGSQ
jgi:hypothetical protein